MSALLTQLLPLIGGFLSDAGNGEREGSTDAAAKEAALIAETERLIRETAATVERTTGKRITLSEAHDVAEDAEDRILNR